MDDILPLPSESITPRIAWDSVLDDATLDSVSSNETDGAIEHVGDWTPWTFWRPTGGGPHIITAELEGTPTITGWAMAGHDANGLIGMDTWDGSGWVLFAEVVHAGDGSTVYLVGDPVATTKLRFRFTEISFLAVLWAGSDMILPEGVGPGWTDPQLALRATLNPEVSREGVYLGSAVMQWNASQNLEIAHVEAAWARDYWLPFLRTCSTQPFFLHWNRVDWPSSSCLCTKASFGTAAFSSRDFVSLAVSFDVDPGLDRRMTPIDDAPALLLEDDSGPLLLE